MRGGTQVPFAGNASLLFGLGMGVSPAWVVKQFEETNDDADRGQGGVLVEARAKVDAPVGGDLSLHGGFVMRGRAQLRQHRACPRPGG